jgi:biotin carboxyl carrier protein
MMKYITTIADREYTIEILDENQISVDGVVYDVDFESISGQPVFSLLVDGDSHEAYIYPDEDRWEVHLQGIQYRVLVEDEREKRLRSSFGSGPELSGEYYLKAPMPGLVVAIPVVEGQSVAQGDVLVILESMKMQNELKSPRAGKVSRVRVKEGDSVERRQTLLSVV